MAVLGDVIDVIAERELALHTSHGTASVRVQFGRPVRDGSAGPWGCPIRVTAPGRVLERVAYAPDAVEALLLALQMARVEVLCDLPRATGGRLTWLGQPELRFPDLYPPGGDGPHPPA